MFFSMLLVHSVATVETYPSRNPFSSVLSKGQSFFNSFSSSFRGIKPGMLSAHANSVSQSSSACDEVKKLTQGAFTIPKNPIEMEALLTILIEQNLSFQEMMRQQEIRYQEELRAYREEQRKYQEDMQRAIQESFKDTVQAVKSSSGSPQSSLQGDSKQVLEKIQDLHLTVRHLAFATEPLPLSHIIPGDLPSGILGETVKRCIQRLSAFGLTQKKLTEISKKNRNLKINDSVTGFGDCHIRSYRVIRYEQLYGTDLDKMPLYSSNSIAMGWMQKRYFMKAADTQQCAGLHIPERQHVPSHFPYYEEFSKLFTVSNRDEADVLFNCLSFLLLVVDQIEAVRHEECEAEPLENIKFKEDDKGLITVEPCSHYKTLDQVFKRSRQFRINWLVLPSWIDGASVPQHGDPIYLGGSEERIAEDSKLMCVKVLMCNLSRDVFEHATDKVFTSLDLFTKFMLSMGKNIDKSQGIEIDEDTYNLAELFAIQDVSFLGRKVYQPSIQAVLQGKNKERSVNPFHVVSATKKAALDIQRKQRESVSDYLNRKAKK